MSESEEELEALLDSVIFFAGSCARHFLQQGGAHACGQVKTPAFQPFNGGFGSKLLLRHNVLKTLTLPNTMQVVEVSSGYTKHAASRERDLRRNTLDLTLTVP